MKKYACISYVLLIALALPHLAYADLAERITKVLAITNPGLSVESVTDSPIEGVKEIQLSNGEFLYAPPGSDHLFSGRLLAFRGDTMVDLTEDRERQERARMFSELDPATMITFPANGNKVREIYVFTDISCAHCRNFHKHMTELNERGVTVHYLALPRSGLTTPVADTMARIWCSEDQRAAITEVKEGGSFSQKVTPCRAPITEHYTMAQSLGVRGTPSVYDQDGRSLGGYMTPDQVLAGTLN